MFLVDPREVSRPWQTLYNEYNLAMKASLQLRLSQHLALTPQLQQSIRLLQLSTLELQQEVAMAVAQNPLLENEDDWTTSPLRVAADGSLITSGASVNAPDPMMSNGTSSSSSTTTTERSESGDPQGVDEYNGMSSSDNGPDSSSWNLEDYGRSNSGSDDDDLPPLQIHESTTSAARPPDVATAHDEGESARPCADHVPD